MSNPNGRSQLGVGLVGAGAVAHRWYIDGLREPTERYRLVAAADVDEARRRPALEAGVPRFHTSAAQLLDDDDVDVVVVLTRHAGHEQLIRDAISSGRHVYCEKPIAGSGRAARAIRDQAEAAGVKVAAAPQVMFSHRNQRLKELYDEGHVGDLLFGRVSSSNLGPAHRGDTDYDPRWFYQEGGSLESLGVYGLATALWILGPPSSVTCRLGTAYRNREVEFGPLAGTSFEVTAPDSAVAILEFEPGRFVLFDGSYVVTSAPGDEFELHGTEGTLFAGGVGGRNSVSIQRRGAEREPEGRPVQQDWSLAWGVHDLVDAIVEGRAPRADIDLAIATIETLELLHRSAASGAVEHRREVCP